MSVESELSEMSDSGEFEKVASSVLRRADSRYQSAIQTGINPEGKPIADPVDGVGRVKGSDPPHYVFFEYTTTQRSDLDSKWLADPGSESSQPKGDLIKVAEVVEELREESPDARVTVVLVSNRSPKSEVVTSVYEKADSLDLEPDIWGVHELCDFLNNDPDGQYIRSQYFDIDEERLSEPLLRDLSKQSIKAYQESFHIQEEESRVERPELSTILNKVRSSESGSYFVPIVGNSGFGKTVTCYQAMNQWWEKGGPALRLDPDDIQGVKSLSQSLQSALDRLHPTLYSSAGQEAIQLAQDNERLLLVVDDLSRADNPRSLFSKIRNWVGGATDQNSPDSGGVDVTILCPVWPRIWAKLERDVDYTKFADPVELGPFSSDLAVELIRTHADIHGVDIEKEKTRDLAEKIECDPHLIGLLGKLLQRNENIESIPDTSKEILREYVQYSYETASEFSDSRLIDSDFRIAVEKLSLDVLENREFEPTWSTVRNWADSGSDNLDEIRELATQAQILILLKTGAEQLLSFRHDRIRDFLLSTHCLDQITEDEELPSYMSDPYYYSILGKGIAYFRPSTDVLSRLSKSNPLALLEALHELGGDAPKYEEKLGTEFQQWLDEQGGPSEVPRSLLGEAMNILQETQSGQVLEIAKSLPQFPPVQLARFRNGDLEAGIQFCNDDMGGSPNTNHPQRDAVFKEARQRFGGQYAETLSEVLSSVTAEHALGALRLAGFLGRSELISGLEDCWEKHQDDPELLPAFLWAVFQCGIPEQPSLVDQVISQWASLPSGSTIDDSSDEFGKGDVFSHVKFSLTRDPSEAQIRYLVNSVEEFPDVEYHLVNLLSKVADPDALDVVVHKRGENMQKTDLPSPWAITLLDQWRPETARGQALPLEGKHRMKKIWSSEDNIEEVRTSAFQLWARNAQSDDIEELKRVSENDLFSYTANYYRLKLGDETAVRSTQIDFLENDGLLEPLPNAWCPEAFELIDDLLSQHPQDESGELFYHLADVLFRIPEDDAEELLNTHWEKVNNRPKFFQAALYTATPVTRELAKSEFHDSDNPESLFNHLSMNFGFNMYGQSELITQEHLYSLEPYLKHIDEMDLMRIGEKANEIGMKEWAIEHLRPHLSEDWRQTLYPTPDDIHQELNDLEGSEDVSREIRGWMTRFDRRGVSKSEVFDVLEKWLQSDPTVDGYRIVAEIVKNWGTRQELSILDGIPIEDDRIQRLRKDAEFGVRVRSLN